MGRRRYPLVWNTNKATGIVRLWARLETPPVEDET